MNGLAYEADYIVAWPTAEIAVMGPDGAVNIIHRKTIEAVPEERSASRNGSSSRRRSAGTSTRTSPPAMASVDDVIDPADTRAAIARGLAHLGRQARRTSMAQARRPPRLRATRRGHPFLRQQPGCHPGLRRKNGVAKTVTSYMNDSPKQLAPRRRAR